MTSHNSVPSGDSAYTSQPSADIDVTDVDVTSRLDPAELQLIERAKQGDQAAFGQLIEGASRRMWAVIYSIVGNQHDAQDAMQDALVAIWRNLDKYQPRAKFSTWAYRVASNAALQLLRKRKEIVDDEAGADEATRYTEPGEQVSASMVVNQALAALGEEFREALVLREYGGLSYDDIARQQKISVQTVKSRISRARSKLKKELEALGVTSA